MYSDKLPLKAEYVHLSWCAYKDNNFGEMFVGNYKPESIDNLFISIQTFNSQDFTVKTRENSLYGGSLVFEAKTPLFISSSKALAMDKYIGGFNLWRLIFHVMG